MPLLADGGYDLELQWGWGVDLRSRPLLQSAGDLSLKYPTWKVCQTGSLVY